MVDYISDALFFMWSLIHLVLACYTMCNFLCWFLMPFRLFCGQCILTWHVVVELILSPPKCSFFCHHHCVFTFIFPLLYILSWLESGFKNKQVESNTQESAIQGIAIQLHFLLPFLATLFISISVVKIVKFKCRLQLIRYGTFFPLLDLCGMYAFHISQKKGTCKLISSFESGSWYYKIILFCFSGCPKVLRLSLSHARGMLKMYCWLSFSSLVKFWRLLKW